MPETILVGVAWPYPNGSLHLGQIAGAYLPPDIFARYHRIAGNRVLMVSGSDQFGTPITVRAEQEGKTPQEVVDGFHAVQVHEDQHGLALRAAGNLELLLGEHHETPAIVQSGELIGV